MKYDFVLCFVPYELNPWYEKEDEIDKSKYIYGIPNKNSADWESISNVLYSMTDNARGIFVCGLTSLIRKNETEIKKEIILDNIITNIVKVDESTYIIKVDFNNEKDTELNISHNNTDIIKDSFDNNYEKIHIVNRKLFKDNNYNFNLFDLINDSNIFNADFIPLKNTTLYMTRGMQISKSKLLKMKQGSGLKFRLLRLSNITDGNLTINDEDIVYPTNKEIDVYGVKKGDVIITSRGSKINVVVFEDDIDCLVTSNLLLIRFNAEKYDPYVFKFFIDSTYGKMKLDKVTTGSSIKVLTSNNLMNLEVPDLSYDLQKNLSKRIKKLESGYYEMLSVLKKKFDESKNNIYREIGLMKWES